MFNVGDKIYKMTGSVVCLVRWARDDRFGWVPEKHKDNHKAGDVHPQGDPDFELMEKAKPKRIKRKKAARVKRKKVVRKKRENKNEGGIFF